MKRNFNISGMLEEFPNISLLDIHYYGLKGYGIDFDSEHGERPKFHIWDLNSLFSVVPMQPDITSPYTFKNDTLTFNGEELPFNVQFVKWIKGVPSYFYYRNIDEWIQTIDNEIVLTTNFQQRCKGCSFCCRDLQDKLSNITPKKGMDLVMKDRQDFYNIGELAVVTGMFRDEDTTINHLSEVTNIVRNKGFNGHLFYIGTQVRTEKGIQRLLDNLNGVPLRYSYALETFIKREELHPLKVLPLDEIVDTVRMLKQSGVWKMEYGYMPGIDNLESFYQNACKFKDIARPHVSIFRPINVEQSKLVSDDCQSDPARYLCKMREHFEKLYGGPIYGNNLGNLWTFPINRINPIFMTGEPPNGR